MLPDLQAILKPTILVTEANNAENTPLVTSCKGQALSKEFCDDIAARVVQVATTKSIDAITRSVHPTDKPDLPSSQFCVSGPPEDQHVTLLKYNAFPSNHKHEMAHTFNSTHTVTTHAAESGARTIMDLSVYSLPSTRPFDPSTYNALLHKSRRVYFSEFARGPIGYGMPYVEY